MRIEKENLTLPCILTDAEKLNYGQEQAIALQRLEEAEARKQEFNSQIKADIEKHEARAHEIGHKLTSGKEYRDVECKIERNWEEKTRRWIRTDTGEIAKEDIIPERELQEDMELNQEENKSELDAAVESANPSDDTGKKIVHFEKGKRVKK